ncbi:MAG: helix-turn-helix domain-containing protein [Planctomycetota bacterium]
MNAIEELLTTLETRLPAVRLELIRPRDPKGRWILEVEHDEWLVVVVWIPLRGFGLTAGPADDEEAVAYGQSADQSYPGGGEELAEHVVKLLKGKKRTSPPRSVALREIRARCGLTQAELAERLAIRQGTISKLERSEQLDVSKLSQLVQAMGGELELWVRFPDDAPVKLLPPTAPPRPIRARRKRG